MPAIRNLKKQVDAKAGSKDRIAAFKTLLNDLLEASPTITGALAALGRSLHQRPRPRHRSR